MNSFRVMDTKFRILKGGKIGLACSIALIGAMLILGSTKAYSQTYFNGVTDGTTYTSGDISATAKTDTGSSSVTYNFVSSSEDIFFNPERVLSSYKGVMDYEVTGSSPNQSVILSGSSGTNNGTLINNIADGTYTYPTLDSNLDPIIGTENNYDKAYYESFTPSTIFTVRLTSGAEAKNINKNASLYYSVDSATGYNITNNPYTANLIFDGSNTIYGNTNIGNGNIQLNGGVVFKGTVATGSIDVNAGITTFEDTVTATTTTITGGTVILNSNLTGNVVTTGNQGILTTTGVTQTITGDIGSGTSSLDTLNIGSDTVPGNYSKTTINGNVFATNTILNNNNNDNIDGTTNSSELILSSGKNITSTITTADADMGILTLAGGTQTVSGTVGEDGISLKEINAGAAGSTSTFTEDVYALNTNIGSGTVILNSNLTGNVVTTGNQGILTTTGVTQTITGDIGSGTSSLDTLNIGSDTVPGNYSKTTINGNVFATNTILNNNNNDNIDGTTNSSELILSSGKNITSTITTADADMGILTLAGGTQTVSGTVGEDGISLKEINAGVAGSTSTFTEDVYALNTNIGSGTVILNSNLTGNVVTTGNQGILTTTGVTQTITGDIGSGTSSLDTLNIGSDTVPGNYSKTTINGNVFATNTILNNNNNDNIDGTTNSSELILSSGKNITSTITTADADMGILTLAGGTQTVTGQVGNGNKLAEVNAGNGASTFANDVYATNLDVEGTGTVNLGGDFTGTAIRYNADGTVIVATGNDVNSAITNNTGIDSQGTLTLNGSSTVTGQVGASGASLKEINAGVAGTTSTFNSNVYASNLNMTGAGTVVLNSDLTGNVVTTGNNQGILTTTGVNQTITGNIGSSTSLDLNTLNIGSNTDATNYSKTTINGNVFADSTVLNNNGTTNSSELILASGKNITSTITTADANMGILTLAGGIQTVTGQVGNGNKLAEVNAGNGTSTFVNDVYATNLDVEGTGTVNLDGKFTGTAVRYNADGTVILADTKNIDSSVTTTTNNTGTLSLEGSSTVTGQVGASGASLKEINAGVAGTTSTFANDVYATNTNIGSGRVDFNTVSGTTNTNIIFSDNGTANLLNGLTGDINFAGKDATVNVSDGKGILGSVQTLASNNTGIINYQGDGTISGNSINSGASGIKELNINTANQQNSGGPGLVIGYTALARELYADVVNLRNNATLTLKDNVNLINTGSDNILITVDNTNTGTLTFEGTSNITGEVGQSNKVLNTINAGATGKTVTFDDIVYASTLKYSDDGKVVLNGDNNSNASAEGMIGTVDFDNKASTLAIGDDVNLTVGAAGTQFVNGNNAILEFDGSSIITGILGGNTAVNSTFEEIYAGADNKTVTFKNDVYVKESTFHVSGEGTVNFEGNLTGDLIYDADGVVNVSDGKNIIVSSSPVAVTTATTDTGSLNFLGTTLLATDIGTSSERLKNVTFGSAGSAANTYTQNLDKDIYAQNTYIGNGTNKTILEMKDDVKFDGSLTVRANSLLDVNTHDIKVTENLALAANSLTGFKVYTSDITASGSSANVPSGSITTNTLTIDNNAIIKVNYEGTLYGAGSYTLISANSISGTYLGTEANGKVSDNSIIDSIIKVDGNNLILFADRTGGGKYGAEDLYIVKSGIGEHYSNGASQALATLEKKEALGDIRAKIEALDGGVNLTSEKKAQMVEIQKLLAPVANNSSIQSSLTASTLVSSTIKDRISDIKLSSSTDFIPYGYSGYSSGTYTLNNSLWIKAMGSKATQSKVQDYDGYESTTLGFVAGLDRTLRNGATIGLSLAHANTKIDQTDFRSGDNSDTQSIQLSTYGSMDFGDTYVDGILSYAKHSTDSIRTANSGKLSSSSDADQISAKVEVGHRIYFEDLATLTPFTSLEYGNLNQKGYTEKGTSYQNDALKVDSVKVNKGTLGVGAKLSTNLNIGDTVIIPEFKLAAYNAFGDTNADIKAQYVGGGSQFVTPTQDLNKTMFNAGLGVKTTLSESTSVMIGVDYDRSKDGNFEGYSGNVSFRLNF